MARYAIGDMVFLDLEATNLMQPKGTNLMHQPHTIEVYALRTTKKLKKIDELYSLVEPPISIPPHITKITGIDDEMVKGQPTMKEIFKQIKKILKGVDTFVAQNVRYDKDVIEVEAERLNQKIKMPPNLFCTVEQSMHFCGFRMNSKELTAMAEGRKDATAFKNIHRAKADVMKMVEYYRMIESGYLPEHLRGLE